MLLTSAPPERSGAATRRVPSPLLIRRAFLVDRADALAAVVESFEYDRLTLTVGQDRLTARVADIDRVRELVGAGDATTVDRRPLALVNTRYRVVAFAFGVADVPAELRLAHCADIGDDAVIEPRGDQPGWRFAYLSRINP